jgi:hypothetical protein
MLVRVDHRRASVDDASAGIRGLPQVAGRSFEWRSENKLTTVADSSTNSVGLLSGAQIRQCIDEREIFANGDWDSACVRRAAYDVRVSGAGLRIGRKRYTTHNPRVDPIVLEPGSVAFVSTVERFALSHSLSATISPKYETVTQGLLVLYGGLIDPGFGCRPTGTKAEAITDPPGFGMRIASKLRLLSPAEEPEPAGEPLGFLLANVSTDDVVITPGVTKLARIQFTRINPGDDAASAETDGKSEEEDPTESAEEVRERPEPTSGLQFFSQMEETRRKVDDVAHRTENLVVFGIYLIGFAAISAAVAVLVAVLASDESIKASNAVPQSWVGAALIVLVVLALAAALRGRLRGRDRSRRLTSTLVSRAIRDRERQYARRARTKLAAEVKAQQRERKELRSELAEVRSMLAEARRLMEAGQGKGQQ